jgi:hypothetical protein
MRSPAPSRKPERLKMTIELDEWDKEWDRTSHTVSEYQREIREMRERLIWYVARISALETEIREMRNSDARWVQEP